MATFAASFDMPNAVLNITITPTVGTTTGYYAFEIISPTGTTFKSVSTSFFASPAANADTTTAVVATYSKALPLDINGVPLYGTYQYRVLYSQTGSYGTDINSFTETLRSVTISKKYGVITTAPNFGLNQILITDATTYGAATVSSRLISAFVVGGITSTSTSSTLAVAPIGDYLITLTVATTETHNVVVVSPYSDTYTAVSLQSVTAISSSISYYANFPATVNAAKVLLDSYDDIFCSQNRRLNDVELAKYLQITSKLALIGAALHASSSISSAVEAMKELELLVQ